MLTIKPRMVNKIKAHGLNVFQTHVFCVFILIPTPNETPLNRVEAPIIDHKRDYAPKLEKYKVVQFSYVGGSKLGGLEILFGDIIPQIENIVNI
jgi:hypothetical protein